MPKSAGTSLRRALAVAVDDAVSWQNHIYPDEVIRQIGRSDFERCFKFSFVRNPWDRVVSLYHYLVENARDPMHEKTKGMSFDEYLDVYNHRSKVRQTDWTHDGDRQIVDFVGRHERLVTDFERVCRELGLGKLEIGWENKSSHAPYRSYFDDESRKAVARSRAREIALFGYSF